MADQRSPYHDFAVITPGLGILYTLERDVPTVCKLKGLRLSGSGGCSLLPSAPPVRKQSRNIEHGKQGAITFATVQLIVAALPVRKKYQTNERTNSLNGNKRRQPMHTHAMQRRECAGECTVA